MSTPGSAHGPGSPMDGEPFFMQQQQQHRLPHQQQMCAMSQDLDDASSVGSGEGMNGGNHKSESANGSPGPFKAGLVGTQMYNQAEPVI
jgi:hypothetical protein